MAGGDRSKADSALLAALAGGQTIRDAAAAARVSERTVYRRLDDPDFCRQIAAARDELLARSVGRLADATGAAVAKLVTLLEAESESVQLAAARAILEHSVRLREAAELAARMTELERKLNAKPALRRTG